MLLCLELGRLAAEPPRGLLDRTFCPPALTRRRPECYLGGGGNGEEVALVL